MMFAESVFDYYYGDEGNQFSFCRIPRRLITGGAFKGLSTDAKLLYALMLERMGLSARNGWHDELGRIYIYFTVNEIRQRICHWVRIGSFMVSPPFATAKAGDDFPFRKPSTPSVLITPETKAGFLKIFPQKRKNALVRKMQTRVRELCAV